jgi:hypothetical protein
MKIVYESLCKSKLCNRFEIFTTVKINIMVYLHLQDGYDVCLENGVRMFL